MVDIQVIVEAADGALRFHLDFCLGDSMTLCVGKAGKRLPKGPFHTVSVCRTAVIETKQKAADMQESYTVSGGKKERPGGFQKELYIPFQNLNWSMKEKWKSKVIKPVNFIDKVQKYRRFSQNIE